MQPLSERDKNHILIHTRFYFEELRGKQLFITGGTGFFGCWFLESFLWANDVLKLGARATILSRSPEKFIAKMPHLANKSAIQWIKGDVCSFDFPEGEFGYVIHAATEASAYLNKNNPQRMFDTIVDGTRRTIEFSVTHGTKKFILISSGAVYGPQPSEMSHIPEVFQGAPNPLNPQSAYGEGKRAAEMCCAMADAKNDLEIKIARCFTFVGPHLPLDAHFAIGNFIRDGLSGGPIIIQGDGTPLRSYLYTADLTIWLWTILFNGQRLRPYIVGSDESLSIAEVAQYVADQFHTKIAVEIRGKYNSEKPLERYVPEITRAKKELGLGTWVSLPDAILRTINFAIGIE